MKRTFSIVVIAMVMVAQSAIIFSRVSGTSSQQGPIAGGYADTSNSDPEAMAAARFAVKTERAKLHTRVTLVSIKRAEVQVVAGLNYRLCMNVKIKRKTRNVNVVVYKNLKNKYSLTSWSAGGCKKQ